MEQIDKTAVQRLEHVAKTPFKRLSYTEAVEILEEAIRTKKKKFEFKVRSEHVVVFHMHQQCGCRKVLRQQQQRLSCEAARFSIGACGQISIPKMKLVTAVQKMACEPG